MTVSVKIFEPPKTLSEAGQLLANHMPNGRAWGKKCVEGSVMNGAIKGLASDFLLVQEHIFELAIEFDINLSIDLLPDWEKSVGIPDECIFQFIELEDRRNRVVERLRKIPIVTLGEMQAYVDSFFPEDDIVLIPGTINSGFEFGFEFGFLGDIDERFILTAEIISSVPETLSKFEYTFEFKFTGGPDTALLECILRKVLPANVVLIIRTV